MLYLLLVTNFLAFVHLFVDDTGAKGYIINKMFLGDLLAPI